MNISHAVENRRRKIAEADSIHAGWAQSCLIVRTSGVGEALMPGFVDLGMLFFGRPYFTYGFELLSPPQSTWFPLGSAFVANWQLHERVDRWVIGAQFGFVLDNGMLDDGGSTTFITGSGDVTVLEVAWHLVIQGVASKGHIPDSEMDF